jgi:hypothetical protein
MRVYEIIKVIQRGDSCCEADVYDTSHEWLAPYGEPLEVVKETGLSVSWGAQYKPIRGWQR